MYLRVCINFWKSYNNLILNARSLGRPLPKNRWAYAGYQRWSVGCTASCTGLLNFSRIGDCRCKILWFAFVVSKPDQDGGSQAKMNKAVNEKKQNLGYCEPFRIRFSNILLHKIFKHATAWYMQKYWDSTQIKRFLAKVIILRFDVTKIQNTSKLH